MCDPTNPAFYNVSLSFEQALVQVGLQVVGTEERLEQVLPFARGQERLLLTIGNIPCKLSSRPVVHLATFMIYS